MGIYNLYTYQGNTEHEPLPDEYVIAVFTPSWRRLFLSWTVKSGFAKDFHNWWVELRWAIASRFRYQIYYVEKGNQIVHTSYCSSKSFKFPFMKKDDYHIGPCYTSPLERGRCIYPVVLNRIVKDKKTDDNTLYMIIEQKNTSSAAGVMKAGFVKTKQLERTKFLRKYCIGEGNQ